MRIGVSSCTEYGSTWGSVCISRRIVLFSRSDCAQAICSLYRLMAYWHLLQTPLWKSRRSYLPVEKVLQILQVYFVRMASFRFSIVANCFSERGRCIAF